MAHFYINNSKECVYLGILNEPFDEILFSKKTVNPLKKVIKYKTVFSVTLTCSDTIHFGFIIVLT